MSRRHKQKKAKKKAAKWSLMGLSMTSHSDPFVCSRCGQGYDSMRGVCVAEGADGYGYCMGTIVDTASGESEVAVLVCGKCRDEQAWDAKRVGQRCFLWNKQTSTVCDGLFVRGTKMIKLPDSLKTGKKNSYNASGGSNSSNVSYGTQWAKCSHPGSKVIVEYDGKKVFASNSDIPMRSGKWDLVVDLGGVAYIPKPQLFVGDGPAKYRPLKKLIVDKDDFKYPEVLRLHWQDMGVPPVGLSFWREMWALMPERTCFCCIGGHGRTGTALASLMIAAGTDYYSAISTVRTEHCSKAIETLGQETYLHNLYLEVLAAELKAAVQDNDADTAKSVQAEIDYAKAHKPTSESSYGEAKDKQAGKEGKKESFQGSKTSSVKVEDVTDEECGVKTVAGVVYVKECVEAGCFAHKCDEPKHQGWVKWDESFAEFALED